MTFKARENTAAGGAAAAARARVYTVAPGRPFLTALAEALLTGNLPVAGGPRPAPLGLADVTLLLPTRRATRALQEAFLHASDGAALLLPKIRPIFGAADDSALFLRAEDLAAGGAETKPAIGEIERHLALTQLVMRWSEAQRGHRGRGADIAPYGATVAGTPAQAGRLARELARLMDAMEIESVDFARMQTLVPDEFSEHWSATLEFLKIVTEHWPGYLTKRGVVSAMHWNKQRLVEEASHLESTPPGAPVIVAGVMSSVPAMTEYMRVVSRLSNGALVLPALDQALDEESWAVIGKHPEHPQFGLKKLLDALGLKRTDVQPLPGAAATALQQARASFVSEAMRPAGTTERWHRFTAGANRKQMAQALAGVSVLEAPSAEEEAETIALILREVAQTPGRTAALVSPDRLLARRVSVRLEAWGLRVDDSAGLPFARTVPGAFLDLVAEAVASEFAPVALMALLKHPLCRLGLAMGEMRRAAHALELAAFRSPYFGKGLEGVETALEQAKAAWRGHRAVRALKSEDWRMARELQQCLAQAFRPMLALFASPAKASLHELAAAHIKTAELLAKTSHDTEGPSLWQGEAGEEAAKLFAALLDAAMLAPDMQAADYPEFYRSLIADETIRPRGARHPRIFIWEPYESRLQQPDVVILGSLNEGTWPQTADPGPWLNRPMRATLGLPAPEERIGDAAHIFTSLLGADRVYLTRAAKVDGVPTVPSRWLLRLRALAGGMELTMPADQPWLAWAQARNAIDGPARPVKAPEPRPAVALRPRKLSVTAIEKWIANPYALFAQRVLSLEPLPVLGEPPGAALRGQVVHEALSRFARAFPDQLPKDTAKELLAIAEKVIADYTGNPRVAAFWAPRFARFAAWFAETEGGRRKGVTKSLAEVDGKMVLAAPAGAFTLTARADRIDVGDGSLVVTDYKTGSGMDKLAGRAIAGEAPQLPLEAAIAIAGGFAGVPAGPVTALRYISASGGEPPGQQADLKVDDVAALARDAQAGLEALIAEFDSATTPYRALRRGRFNYDYDDYAQLARVAEWQAEMVEEA